MKKILFILSLSLLGLQVSFGQIIIANTYVVNTNTYDTIQGELITGSVTYNPETKTLTLENATIFERTPNPDNMEPSNGVLYFGGANNENRLAPVCIKLLGNNVLVPYSPVGWGILGLYCTRINILGPGNLIVGAVHAVTMNYVQELTVQEGAIVRFSQPSVTGVEHVGISSFYERTTVLIDSSTLICETGIPFRNIADLQLSRCHIGVPENAYFDEQTGTMLNADNTSVNGYFAILPGSGTDVTDYSDGNSVAVYPNPAKEFINVRCANDNGQWNGATVEVFDIYGKLIHTVTVVDNPARVNVSALPEGVYLLRVTGADGHEYHRKIVKR